MPTYEFACDDCEVMLTAVRTYEDRKRPEVCPQCGKGMLYVFPAPVFYFEGGSPTAKLKSQVTSKEQFLEGVDDDL